MRKIFNVQGTNDRHKEVLTPPASHRLRHQLCAGGKGPTPPTRTENLPGVRFAQRAGCCAIPSIESGDPCDMAKQALGSLSPSISIDVPPG